MDKIKFLPKITPLLIILQFLFVMRVEAQLGDLQSSENKCDKCELVNSINDPKAFFTATEGRLRHRKAKNWERFCYDCDMPSCATGAMKFSLSMALGPDGGEEFEPLDIGKDIDFIVPFYMMVKPNSLESDGVISTVVLIHINS